MRERDRKQPLHVSRSRPSPVPPTMTAPDKQTKSSTPKPFTPALSSNFRNVKSPLTPRVAGSPTPSPTVSSTKQPFVRSKSPAKPGQTTTPLGGNITPRSAARRSRVGTESPLTPAQPRVPPNGQRSRAASGNEGQKPVTGQAQGLGITSPRLVASTPSLAKGRIGSPSPAPVITVHRRVSAAKSAVEGNKNSAFKFFRAGEAKSAVGSPGNEENERSPPKPGHFFVGPPPPPAVSNGKPDPDEKFFRANDLPPIAPAKRSMLPRMPVDRLDSPVATTPGHDHFSTPPQSPKKTDNAGHPALSSPRKYTPTNTPSPPAQRITADRPRSSSSGISQVLFAAPGHRKSLSADSKTSQSAGKLGGPRAQAPLPLDLRIATTLSPRIVGGTLLSPDTLSPRSLSLTSTNTIPASMISDTDLSEIAALTTARTNSFQVLDQPQSPVRPRFDQASNARRERKVLDLEISNSSLLAINKTLERELRKQSTELRRYRRLSRSGRLSIIAPSNRTVSDQSKFSLDTVTENDGEDTHLSDLDDSDFEDPDDENSSLISTSTTSASPSAISRQRTRDEKRLMQDLARHQQLLLDSQKLNQSIRRCMTCTDDMIREGNKALDYRVGIGDVKIGGRVLNDEELDEGGARQGLLSPSIGKASLKASPWDAAASVPMGTEEAAKEKEKGSSGIIDSLDELTDLLDSVSAELVQV